MTPDRTALIAWLTIFDAEKRRQIYASELRANDALAATLEADAKEIERLKHQAFTYAESGCKWQEKADATKAALAALRAVIQQELASNDSAYHFMAAVATAAGLWPKGEAVPAMNDDRRSESGFRWTRPKGEQVPTTFTTSSASLTGVSEASAYAVDHTLEQKPQGEQAPEATLGIEQRCAGKAALLIEPLRAVARTNGYALLVHGSLRRDIDMVAVPWTQEAVSHETLVQALVACANNLNGFANVDNGRTVKGHVAPIPEWKPHGRRCWSIHLGGGPYIDLSVMPLGATPAAYTPDAKLYAADDLERAMADVPDMLRAEFDVVKRATAYIKQRLHASGISWAVVGEANLRTLLAILHGEDV